MLQKEHTESVRVLILYRRSMHMIFLHANAQPHTKNIIQKLHTHFTKNNSVISSTIQTQYQAIFICSCAQRNFLAAKNFSMEETKAWKEMFHVTDSTILCTYCANSYEDVIIIIIGVSFQHAKYASITSLTTFFCSSTIPHSNLFLSNCGLWLYSNLLLSS